MGCTMTRYDWESMHDTIVQMTKDCFKNSEIADALGVPRPALLKYKTRVGLESPRGYAPDRELMQKVKVMTKQGKSAPEIAAILGTNVKRVHRYRAATGVAKQRPPFWSDEKVRQIEQMVNDGVYPAEIARTLGVSSHQVRRRFPQAKRMSRSETAELRKVRRQADRVLDMEFGIRPGGWK